MDEDYMSMSRPCALYKFFFVHLVSYNQIFVSTEFIVLSNLIMFAGLEKT